ncbi:hypothetical protein B0O99DRAFT_694597 [Bisporella sp. PMI_857]|nr:hypothetical protein B0O99DRAFT_694597 [Bisporella sp. PMI_857]
MSYSTPRSTPEPETDTINGPGLSAAQKIEMLEAEVLGVRMDLDEVNVRLLHASICHESEVKCRWTMQHGLDTMQQRHSQLSNNYQSIIVRYGREKSQLQEQLRIAEELIDTQKQMIDYQQQQQQRQQQQQEQEQQYLAPLMAQYTQYEQPPDDQFSTNPVGLSPPGDVDYSITSSLDLSCGTSPIIPPPPENRVVPPMSLQAVIHPTSTSEDAAAATLGEPETIKRGIEDEGQTRSKKRRTK